jgi:hypothetical protein
MHVKLIIFSGKLRLNYIFVSFVTPRKNETLFLSIRKNDQNTCVQFIQGFHASTIVYFTVRSALRKLLQLILKFSH